MLFSLSLKREVGRRCSGGLLKFSALMPRVVIYLLTKGARPMREYRIRGR